MKTKSFLSALLLIAVCVGSVSISSCSKDASEENKPVDNTGGDPSSNSGGNTDRKTGFTNGHEWVDLGLPSGTLWATCNVGASKPEEYGSYFAWGEIKTKSEYTPENYFDSQYEKYSFDGQTELLPGDDAATANWGNGWQMPSFEQMAELVRGDYTTPERITQNGHYGLKITSKSNGKSIFLPAAGYRYNSSLKFPGNFGDYWTRSLSTSNEPHHLDFYSPDGPVFYSYKRCYGRSIRPVRKK